MEDREMLAIFDRSGRRIGIKPRAEVHRDGDWHWLVFVWAARVDEKGQIHLLLQIRARPDDPYLGQLDAPAGGHVGAAEGYLEGAIREFTEEVGIRLEEEELVYLGEKRLENPDGICQRVIEHFYLCTRPIDLTQVVFNPEVNGFVELELESFADLLVDKRERIVGRTRMAAAGGTIGEVEVTASWLAAYSEAIAEDFRRSLQAIRHYLDNGEPDLGIWI